MSTSTTGANDALADAMITELISGGATVHLIGGGATMSYTDGATEISTDSDAEVAVAEADWTISVPADFSGTATLENDNELDFGSPSIGTVDQIVIQNDSNTDYFVLADEPNDPDLTGENVTIAAGTTMYELGNPT